MSRKILIERYLVVGANIDGNGYLEGKPNTRLSVNKPGTSSDEIAIKLNLELPVSLFMKQQLSANISIAEDQCADIVIDADTVNQIKALAAEELGVDLNITVSNVEGS